MRVEVGTQTAFLLKLAGGVGGAVQASLPLVWFFVACSLWTHLGR